jgi:hypothetical protein
MGGGARGSASAGWAVTELTEEALRSFLRGGTWPGLGREIAWQAVLATGAEHACLDWLTGLVEERLAERVDGLAFLVARACAAAGAEHLRIWPHDLAGGETAALLEGQEEAAHALGALYMEVLDWASDLLSTRLHCDRRGQRPRLPPPKQTRSPAEVEPPNLVADALDLPRDRFGWPRRHAA